VGEALAVRIKEDVAAALELDGSAVTVALHAESAWRHHDHRDRVALGDERLPGLEQRLQAAEHEHPASGDALRRLRRAFELVVHDGELRVAAVLRLDLPRDAAVLLDGGLRVVERAPSVDEAVRWVDLDDASANEIVPFAVQAPPLARRHRHVRAE